MVHCFCINKCLLKCFAQTVFCLACWMWLLHICTRFMDWKIKFKYMRKYACKYKHTRKLHIQQAIWNTVGAKHFQKRAHIVQEQFSMSPHVCWLWRQPPNAPCNLVTVSCGCRAAGAWSIRRIRFALPPRPLYTFMAWCWGTGSNRANLAQFVFGRCPLQVSARTPISLQAFSLFYSVPSGVWRDSTSKLSRDHYLPPLQFTIHDTMIWLLIASNKCNHGDNFAGTLTLLPRGLVKVTCTFVRLYFCPNTEEQLYGTTLSSSAMAEPYVEWCELCIVSWVWCIVSYVCRC
jgi:hypothetical protein